MIEELEGLEAGERLDANHLFIIATRAPDTASDGNHEAKTEKVGFRTACISSCESLTDACFPFCFNCQQTIDSETQNPLCALN